MRNTTLRPLSIALMSLSLITACASSPERRGPPPGDRPQERFAGETERSASVAAHPFALYLVSLDQNDDTLITRDEFNHDLNLSWESFARPPTAITYQNWLTKQLGSPETNPSFLRLDRNFDGVLTEDEFKSGLSHMFTRLDTDQSGDISRSEMVFTAPTSRNQRGDRRSRGRGGDQPGQERPPRP